MINHHTKNKGDLGVLKVKCDLTEKGYLVLNPETEHAPFDIVAYKENYFKRIQVKYRSTNKTGSLDLQFRSCWSDKNGVHTIETNKDEIDLYAIYCPDTNECYYLDPNKFNRSVILRVKTPKNNQKKGINLASDYREVP